LKSKVYRCFEPDGCTHVDTLQTRLRPRDVMKDVTGAALTILLAIA
jgi:hypothetical protein